MLRLRLITGTLLSLAIIALMLLDGHLSVQPHGVYRVNGVDLVPFLYNGAFTTLILLVLTWLTARELVQFVRQLGYRPAGTLAKLFAAGLVVGPYMSMNLAHSSAFYDESWGMAWMTVALGLAFLVQGIRSGTQHAIGNLATTLFILFYSGGLAGFLTKLRMELGDRINGQAGVAAVLFSVFIVKITDVGAYFTGRLLGRHKMIEWLSPKKTWEGLAGGLAAAVGFSLALGLGLRGGGFEPFQSGLMSTPHGLALFGLVMGVFSVLGDLCASLLKRDAAVKDSGQALPGLGGVLDVLDSPLLCAPLAWFFWTRLNHLA